jgi:hypothetical protein
MAIPAIQYTVHAADLDGHRYEVTLRIANPNPAGTSATHASLDSGQLFNSGL